ncbi:MAG: PEGA domain-containing protein [Lachnospiraceae bacterium]|nr:PEGA domain-containing protein [Lachnospiraceae bacterium]
MKKYASKIILFLLLAGCLLAGCGKEQPEEPETEVVMIQSTYKETLADSMDEGIIMSVDQEKKQIKMYNLTLGRTYSLTYDGVTGMKNRFGDEIVAGQLAEGDMVRVTFIKENKLARSVQLLDDIDTSNVSAFEINKAAYTMSFGGDKYSLHKNVLVLSGGKQIQMEEISPADSLKIVARDHQVYGITVEQGHGYVRLSGHESFVGGWVEIGQTVITRVEEEMLLVVPEGDYTLYISNKGVAGSKEISVSRDAETQVDVSELQTERIKKSGKIIFTISPAEAELYIDGELTDYSGEVELDYGIHQLKVKAEGYSTFAQYIKVSEPMANLNVKLEESTGEEDEEKDEKTVSSNSVSNTTAASDYRVYIDAPKDAELYLDGSYVGIVPVSFPKKTGTYVISLRRDGYLTRSYTLQIDDIRKDVTYSFSELVAQ